MNSMIMNNNSMLSALTQNSVIMKKNKVYNKEQLMVKDINKLSLCIKSMYKNIKKELTQYKVNNTNDHNNNIQSTLNVIETYLTSFANEAKSIFHQLKENRKSISQGDNALLQRRGQTNISNNINNSMISNHNITINKSSLLHTYSVLSPSDTNSKVLSSLTSSPLVKTWNNEKDKESFMSYKGYYNNNSMLNKSGSYSYSYNNHKRSNSNSNSNRNTNNELNHLLGTIKHICKYSSVNNSLIKSRNNEEPLIKRKVLLGLLENVAGAVQKEKSNKKRKCNTCRTMRTKSLNEGILLNRNDKVNEDNKNEVQMLKKELDNKINIINKLKQELNENSVSKLNEKIKVIEKEIQIKNERIKELEHIEKMFICSSNNNNRYKRNRNINEKSNSIIHYSIDNIKSVDSISNSVNNNNKPKQKVIELTQQLQCQFNIINTLHTNNSNDEVCQLKTEIQSQHAFIEQLKQHHESQLNTMKFHLNNKTTEIQALQNEIDTLNQTIQTLNKQIKDNKPIIYNKEQSELIRNVEILKNENEKFVKENAKLRNDLMVKTNSYLTLQNKFHKEKALFEKEIKEKTNNLNDMKITLKHKCEMLVNQASLIEKTVNEKNELEELNAKLNSKIKLKEETIHLLSENNKGLLKEKEKLIKQLKKIQK